MFCILCGRSEDEVKKLFCFPRNAERSNIWQRSMKMVPKGVLATSIKICNEHFSTESFVPKTYTLRLRRDAIPTILPRRLSQESSCQTIGHRSEPEDFPQQLNINQPMESPSSVLPKELRMDNQEVGSFATSSREQILRKTLSRKIGQLRKLQRKKKIRGKTIAELLKKGEDVQVLENMTKNLSPTSLIFIRGQFRCGKKLPHGRRWTDDEKILALALYKRSPKCYSLLQRMTTLPSKYTLVRLLKRIPFEVGINQHIFRHLGECVKSFEEKERYCTLVFDEMAIREHIQYNKAKDCMEGVEDLGNGQRSQQLAKYALVFMVQGVTRSWKQPIAYYFTRNGISAEQLGRVLREIISILASYEVPVLATVCDMGTTNVKALQIMGSTCLDPYIMVGERKIFNIYDVPHLLKCTRNLFRSHNVLLPTVTVSQSQEMLEARWSDIVKAYEKDKNNRFIFKSLPKIKDNFLAPLRQTSMKVTVAAKIMSRAMAVYLFNLVEQGFLPMRALATGEFISQVDQMFDSLNGSTTSPPDVKPYKCIVTENSGHELFWEECYKLVEKWRYIRKPSDISNPHPWKPPSQRGWMSTLKAFIGIRRHLQLIGVKSFKPRALNQDALENLFGAVRAGCGFNENPTVTQFVSSLKTQIVNGLAYQSFAGTNCEKDDFNLLTNLRSFLAVPTNDVSASNIVADTPGPSSSHQQPTSGTADVQRVIAEVERCVAEGSMETLSVAYVAGFIVKGIFKYFTCNMCYSTLCSDDMVPCNRFIALKEYSDKTKKLHYPSEGLVAVVGCAITLLEEKLPAMHIQQNIHKKVAAELNDQLNFSFLSCTLHYNYIKKCVIDSTCKIGIPWYCTRQVRDLKTKNHKEFLDRKQRKLQHV